MLRVTADTNVYISAFQFGGRPQRILELAREGRIVLAISPPILQEIEMVLRGKFRRSKTDVSEAIERLSRITESVRPIERVEVVTEDPDDNMVLECAVAAHCDAIVSGDRHLLRLGSYGRIQIVKVADLLGRIAGA